MKNRKTISYLFLGAILLLLLFSFFHPALAQYTNQEKIPGAPQVRSDFVEYMKDIINFGFAILGILALFMLIIGAYQYLMAAGNIGKIDDAKSTIASALFGLILGLTAYIILNKINPDLVNMRAITQISGVGSSPLTVRGTVDLSTVTGNIPSTIQDRMGLYDQYAKAAATKYNVDPNLVRAVIEQESTWNPYANRANADFGMMQINQSSHPNFFTNNDWRDPQSNINYGTSYLSGLLQQSGGDTYVALARYNAGGNGENTAAGQSYASSVMRRYANYQKSGL